MQFLKKHYEKVLLGLVLLGLVGALVFMLFYIATDKQAMEENANVMINPTVKPLPDLDLTVHNAALARLQAPFVLDLDTGNKVFNAVGWKKLPDGQMVRLDNVNMGVRAATVTNINPLYLIITLRSVTTNELGVRYTIEVERQTNSVAAKRKRSYYVSAGDKPNDFFALQESKSAPDNPDTLSLKLVDSGEIVTVTRDQPFQRVEGFMADLRYAPENRTFLARRVGDKISFGGTDYIVLEISKDSVVLSDQSNQKKTTLPLAP